MGLFEIISQGCQSLAATTAPSISAMGIHIVIALATMMLVWFGVQEALASAQGGAGFNIGQVHQPLHAAYLRLRNGELLRQFHPWTRLLHQGIHRRRYSQSRERHWSGRFDDHVEPDPRGVLEDRAVDADQRHVAVLLDRVLCRAVSLGRPGSGCLRHHRLRRNRLDDHRIAWADLHSFSCL